MPTTFPTIIPYNSTHSLKFAETTNYGGTTKRSREKSYSSNIQLPYSSDFCPGGVGWMPLYQIYFNPGTHCWGLWKSPYTKNPWPKPIWFTKFSAALKKANQLWEEEEKEEEMYVALSARLSYHKKLDNSRHPRMDVVFETTHFSQNPRYMLGADD